VIFFVWIEYMFRQSPPLITRAGALKLPLRIPLPHYDRRSTRTIVAVSTLENVSQYVGDFITYFTIFFCTMNWSHYRTRVQQEEGDEGESDGDASDSTSK
jgi:hypothetical protein